MKNRKLLLIVSIVLALTMSLGGTLAYLQDTDADVNVMTMGSVTITQNEQERDENGELQPFTPNKPAMPAVGPVEWAEEGVEVNGTDYKVFTDELKNVVDKIVTVTNTGKSDAYVRTIVAIEAPGYDENSLIHMNYNGTDYTISNPYNIQIDDVEYVAFVFTYNTALGAGKTSAPSLVQLFLDAKTTNEDVAAFGDNWEVLVLSQAVQIAGFEDATTALNTAFNEGATVSAESIQAWFEGWDEWSAETGEIGTPGNEWPNNNPPYTVDEEVADDEGLKDALGSNEKEIVIELTRDVTYDVAAWAANGMGGEETEEIVILGNGHTLTFNQTNSDWNNVVTNGAKLVLCNVNITNAGYNNGPWNRHDINFACDVEMTNVTSDKALAFKAGAKLTNVTISDANTSDTYAIWIQPNGQTVTLDGCTIDMLSCSDGRGIKIDEQYMATSEVEKVTLVVKDTTFKTEEKSAILVKSVAGADITLSNVDISGVAADTTNAVWVDEASAAYYDLVTVTGGTKVQE